MSDSGNSGASPGSNSRDRLTRLLRYFLLAIGAALVYVLLDFAIDIRPKSIPSEYRFEVPSLAPDEARILRRDNLSILVIRRSAATIEALQGEDQARLQDSASRYSHQPGYARNPLRSRQAEYFVSYATGTDLGCALQVLGSQLAESCGTARYDFAGRALRGANGFPNLSIPDYNFTDNFSRLTVYP